LFGREEGEEKKGELEMGKREKEVKGATSANLTKADFL
jgi:hypothetical protein